MRSRTQLAFCTIRNVCCVPVTAVKQADAQKCNFKSIEDSQGPMKFRAYHSIVPRGVGLLTHFLWCVPFIKASRQDY